MYLRPARQRRSRQRAPKIWKEAFWEGEPREKIDSGNLLARPVKELAQYSRLGCGEGPQKKYNSTMPTNSALSKASQNLLPDYLYRKKHQSVNRSALAMLCYPPV